MTGKKYREKEMVDFLCARQEKRERRGTSEDDVKGGNISSGDRRDGADLAFSDSFASSSISSERL